MFHKLAAYHGDTGSVPALPASVSLRVGRGVGTDAPTSPVMTGKEQP